jgi:hypothetical protein
MRRFWGLSPEKHGSDEAVRETRRRELQASVEDEVEVGGTLSRGLSIAVVCTMPFLSEPSSSLDRHPTFIMAKFLPRWQSAFKSSDATKVVEHVRGVKPPYWHISH